jgi:SAM-dependent methyltransferase
MLRIKELLKKSSWVRSAVRKLSHERLRDDFVKGALGRLVPGSVILDAGCGSQRYRSACSHLVYKAQDFGGYTVDEKRMLGSIGAGGIDGYSYGPLDYTGDVWNIPEKKATFDAILCTEVFEHIPYPNDTVKEFSRLLKDGGTLILTAPSNCLRHMDPFFYYSGFSDRWFEKLLPENGLQIVVMEPVGDYYSWLACEMRRLLVASSIWSWPIVIPALLYFLSKRPTNVSVNTLCMGYHIVATKYGNAN